MEAFETIFTRRSVRKFLNKPVEEEKIEKMLRAAMAAPSALNQQPWHFMVITDREILNQIPAIQQHAQMCQEAPMAVVVCGDLSLEKAEGFWIEDVSAATQNLLLAARALDLGAVWCGFYPVKERVEGLQELLNLPKNVIPLNVIPMGYTETAQKEIDRFQPERIHQDRW